MASTPDSLETTLNSSHTIRLKLFENRWRFAVFPAMVAFFILCGFGFYLIWGMLNRMQALSSDLSRMTMVIAETMPVMQGGIVGMSSKMQKVGDDLSRMADDVREMTRVVGNTMPSMEQRLIDMSKTMHVMSYSTASMANTTDNMGRNLWSLNRSVSKPMSFFGDMMPWGSNSSNSLPPPPPRVMPVSMQRVYAYTNPSATMPTVRQNTIVARNQSVESKQQRKQGIPKTAGESHFNGYCASCHGINAEGGVGPSLLNRTADSISDMLMAYKDGELEGTAMPGVVRSLTPTDIDNISKYIDNRFRL